MENKTGEFVDLYCPRKFSASNRIIHAEDHASIQLSIAEVDPQTVEEYIRRIQNMITKLGLTAAMEKLRRVHPDITCPEDLLDLNSFEESPFHYSTSLRALLIHGTALRSGESRGLVPRRSPRRWVHGGPK
ncbi:hypothetical protein ILUMI_05247 [Ignelater luminosus]|uniref:Uncharacterized protein n=1 Tax=Ignelater luminosus TaxID=2038154 RepID=A0A8K0D7N1_IGNLU|nr:hypothetical protein ILUMI_05247 [Ignelater luminosus]